MIDLIQPRLGEPNLPSSFSIKRKKTITTITTGHRDSRSLPIPTRQDELHYQSLPPERLLRLGCHLFGHPQGRLVPRPHPQIHPDLAPVSPVFTRTQRPPGRRGRQTLHVVQTEFQRYCEVLDPNLCGRTWS